MSEVRQGTSASDYQNQAWNCTEQQSDCGHFNISLHISALPYLTFAMKSLLQVVQDVREPPHIINQLHHVLRVHSGRPHQVRRQPHGAQRVGVLGVSAHIPGLGGSRRQRPSVGLRVVFVLCPATATAAVALPDHPSKPPFSGATAAQLAPEVTKLLGSWNECEAGKWKTKRAMLRPCVCGVSFHKVDDIRLL